MSWTVIFRDAVPGVAGVVVYDKGQRDILGRYCVAKTMKLPNGRTLHRQTNYVRKQAAVNYAEKFLERRGVAASTKYNPGDGAKTLAFSPVLKGGAR